MTSPKTTSGMNTHYNQSLIAACCSRRHKQGCMRAGCYAGITEKIYSVFTAHFCMRRDQKRRGS